MTEEPAIFLSDTEAPAFTFIDKVHQGKDGKGWRQSKDEGAYIEQAHPDIRPLVPEQWTGEYVIKRLIEAFKTDRYCKMDRPKQTGGAHPQISYEQEDREGWIADDRPILIGPSKEHFDRMEEAFGWLTFEFRLNPARADALRGYCIAKARKWSWSRYCRENGLTKSTMNDRAFKAANDIATMLAACKTPI